MYHEGPGYAKPQQSHKCLLQNKFTNVKSFLKLFSQGECGMCRRAAQTLRCNWSKGDAKEGMGKDETFFRSF